MKDVLQDLKLNHEYANKLTKIIYKEESYKIMGACFEVYNNLGPGFLEIVYKDALEYEFNSWKIPFERELAYNVKYKDTNLPHSFYADFVVFDKIILEIKAVIELSQVHTAQCINYLKVSGLHPALLVNFADISIDYKRIINS